MELSYFDRAQVLVEALPYIQDYSGKTIVVKYGGDAMDDPELRKAVISDLILLKLGGFNVVLVHGGGPEIGMMLEKAGKKCVSADGGLYIDQETMDLIEMVLCGKVNKELVDQLGRGGVSAVGLCGLDGGMLKAVAKKGPAGQDCGLAGEITAVEPKVILDAVRAGFIPVISTVAQGSDAGVTYSVNADAAASKIATALRAEKLILLTGVRGLLRDKEDESTLISQARLPEIPALIRDGTISGGMLSKVECCVEAVRNGVKRTHILDGRIPHSILIEVLSHAGSGTMIL